MDRWAIAIAEGIYSSSFRRNQDYEIFGLNQEDEGKVRLVLKWMHDRDKNEPRYCITRAGAEALLAMRS